MTNKEELKKEIEKDINPKNNYDEIIKRINKKPNKKINIFRYALIPTCLVILMGVTIILNTNENDSRLYSDKNANTTGDVTININTLDNITVEVDENHTHDGKPETNFDVLDYKEKIITYQELITEQPFIANIKLPVPLNNSKFTKVYNASGSIFKEYILYYYNTVNDGKEIDKSITIYFSKNDNNQTWVQNIKLDELKETMINNYDVRIFKYGNDYNYHIIFKYNDLYFYIQTFNIKENELISLLKTLLI